MHQPVTDLNTLSYDRNGGLASEKGGMTSQLPAPEKARLKAILESLLFVADQPVEITALARAVELTPAQVSEALEELAADCRERGLRVQRLNGFVQMVTSPEVAPYVERFLGVEQASRLSAAALETLAIIAYRQPVTRAAIEAIRGVNCERALATLKARGLIEEVGRLDGIGRPALFGTTLRFLEYFGLERLEDLPPLPDPMCDEP